MNTRKKHSRSSSKHYSVVVIGGGQAGLSMSHYLREIGIKHLVIEKNRILNAWKDKRWDSFRLGTPNWQCKLPGHPYQGDNPSGFMHRQEIINYLQEFAQKVDAPVLEQTEVTQVTPVANGYYVETSKGIFSANAVVVATGDSHTPVIPEMAKCIPFEIYQLHSEQYKSPRELPDGSVLVVGSGQSGTQIATEVHSAGRKVFLATSDAPRYPCYYRGRELAAWFDDMDYFQIPRDEHPLGKWIHDKPNHYISGHNGGRDIDLRQLAKEGLELLGTLREFDGDNLLFEENLKDNLARADELCNVIKQQVDHFITTNSISADPAAARQPAWSPGSGRSRVKLKDSAINTIIWCNGYKADFSWLTAPVFNWQGRLDHYRGVTNMKGLYFLGLPWLHNWGSGQFSGISGDAKYLAYHIKTLLNHRSLSQTVAGNHKALA